VALLFATLLGALWGAIPGALKAYFNVNEVITCIMLNYIALFWVNMTIKGNKVLRLYHFGSRAFFNTA
jgi:simple sugar transport system permease protein